MSFAALETRLNTAVAAKMANATAVWKGVDVSVVFRTEEHGAGAGQMVGGGARITVVECPLASWGAVAPVRGDDLKINGVDYTVGTRDVDTTGWCKLSVSKS